MAMRLVVIDGFDRGEVFPLAAPGTLTIGNSRREAAIVLHDLYVSRAHCRLEVGEDRVVVVNGANAHGTLVNGKKIERQELRPGDVLRVGNSHLRLESDEQGGEGEGTPEAGAAEAPAPEGQGEAAPPGPAAALPPGRRVRRLKVVEGADWGRHFRLLEAGTMIIGSNARSADIVLHDLYVARVHCRLEVDENRVVVAGDEGLHAALINGQRVLQQELRPGDVLRVGNTHLRLEVVPADRAAAADEDDGEGIAVARNDRAAAAAADEVPGAPAHPAAGRLAGLKGQTLGHYKVSALLGWGHCGAVFRARDTRSGQLAALKVLFPEFPSQPAELQRFVEALKPTQHLRHPNLVPLCGVGKAGPYSWLARQYVEGEGVDQLVEKLGGARKIDWSHACRVLVHAGRALEFLRQHHVVHGNVTPRNLLVRGPDQRALLADLMWMKALEGSTLQQATLENKVLAELPYMAPEQIDPNASVDYLTDLYGLGAVVYALLTGRPPFGGGSPEETIEQIQEARPARPSKYQKDIPAALDEVVLRLLRKRQEERYPSPTELLADVEPLAAKHGVALDEPGEPPA
jgi:serine/threonine-protein kinase